MRPLEDDVDKMLLHRALGHLPPRERQIISLRFGIGTPKALTQKEVCLLYTSSMIFLTLPDKSGNLLQISNVKYNAAIRKQSAQYPKQRKITDR